MGYKYDAFLFKLISFDTPYLKMSLMLPKEINYDLPVSLPSGVQTFDINVLPVNGTSFSCATAGAFVHFDLPARSGYMDGKTLALRYNILVFQQV